MLLTDLKLPPAPVAAPIETIRLALQDAVDLNGRKINASCLLGLDTAFQDIILGKQLNPDLCPAIRIMWDLVGFKQDASGHAMVEARIMLHYYFIYYVGGVSDFQDRREAHIRWNMEHLQMRGIKPNPTKGLTIPSNTWRFMGDEVIVDHETPFRYFDHNLVGGRRFVELAEGYTVSRVDDKILVHNHPT